MHIPIHKIDLNLISRVTSEAWPQACFSIENQTLIKEFYNKAYKNFESRLEEALQRFHPAGIMLEAYKQLHLWTTLFYELDENLNGKGLSGWESV